MTYGNDRKQPKDDANEPLMIIKALQADNIHEAVLIMTHLSQIILRDVMDSDDANMKHVSIASGLMACCVKSYELGLEHGDKGTPITFAPEFKEQLERIRKRINKKKEDEGL